MNQSAVHVSDYGSDYINGDVSLDTDGLVVFSIPYDEGWTVTVDGMEEIIEPVADGLMGVYMEEGTHELELSYVSPGFSLGMLLTILGLVLFVLLCILTKKRGAIKQRLTGRFHIKAKEETWIETELEIYDEEDTK
jgi:uncharacterized membrane protein YfhO